MNSLSTSNQKIAIINKFCIASSGVNHKTVAKQLTGMLVNNYHLLLYCSKKGRTPIQQQPTNSNSTCIQLPFKAKGIGGTMCNILAVFHAMRNADVLLFFNLHACIFLPIVYLFSSKKTIVHIESLLPAVKPKKLRESLFHKLCLFVAVKFANNVVVADLAMQQQIGFKFNTASRIVNYGGNHCNSEMITSNNLKQYPFLHGAYAFSIINLTDKLTTQDLLETFERFSGYPLVAIANFTSSNFGKLLLEKYKTHPNIYLIEYPTNKQTYEAIRTNCNVYIHTHATDGASLPLIEAMNLAIPVIALNAANNKAITNNKGFYFKTAHDLFSLLYNLDTHDLNSIGSQLQEVANANYTWPKITQQYAAIINEQNYADKKSTIFSKNIQYTDQLLLSLNAGHLKHTKLFFAN